MKLNITVDGKTYEVDVEASEPERPAYPIIGLQAPAAAAPAAVAAPAASAANETVADESKVSRSPVNGTVVRVDAKPGQKVESGETVLVVEAMKMETAITAPVSGTLAEVRFGVGDAVKSGHVLLVIE